jgi:hypothetical protein
MFIRGLVIVLGKIRLFNVKNPCQGAEVVLASRLSLSNNMPRLQNIRFTESLHKTRRAAHSLGTRNPSFKKSSGSKGELCHV